MYKHSTWGVPSQGRNSKELTARENNGGTLGFNRKQRLKPYQYLYVDFTFSFCEISLEYILFLFFYFSLLFPKRKRNYQITRRRAT